MRRIWLVTVVVALAAGCISSGLEPLAVEVDEPSGGATATVVLLRGIGGSNRTFARRGWVDEVRARGLAWRVVAPDADLGYYRARTLVPRLAEDVVAPARARGFERVWLVGLSMGGMGGLYYLMEHPEDVAGLVLLAPYLGPPEVAAEIRAAGGLRAWRPPPEITRDNWEWGLWGSIQTLLSGPQAPPVHLIYARGDKHVAGQSLLAENLPAERVLVVDGPHRNPTFDAMWREVLDRGMIAPVPPTPQRH